MVAQPQTVQQETEYKLQSVKSLSYLTTVYVQRDLKSFSRSSCVMPSFSSRASFSAISGLTFSADEGGNGFSLLSSFGAFNRGRR